MTDLNDELVVLAFTPDGRMVTMQTRSEDEPTRKDVFASHTLALGEGSNSYRQATMAIAKKLILGEHPELTEPYEGDYIQSYMSNIFHQGEYSPRLKNIQLARIAASTHKCNFVYIPSNSRAFLLALSDKLDIDNWQGVSIVPVSELQAQAEAGDENITETLRNLLTTPEISESITSFSEGLHRIYECQHSQKVEVLTH